MGSSESLPCKRKNKYEVCMWIFRVTIVYDLRWPILLQTLLIEFVQKHQVLQTLHEGRASSKDMKDSDNVVMVLLGKSFRVPVG